MIGVPGSWDKCEWAEWSTAKSTATGRWLSIRVQSMGAISVAFFYAAWANCIIITYDRTSYSKKAHWKNVTRSEVGILYLRFFMYQDNSYKHRPSAKVKDNVENSISGRKWVRMQEWQVALKGSMFLPSRKHQPHEFPQPKVFYSRGTWAYERQWGMGFFVEERSSFFTVDNAGKS